MSFRMRSSWRGAGRFRSSARSGRRNPLAQLRRVAAVNDHGAAQASWQEVERHGPPGFVGENVLDQPGAESAALWWDDRRSAVFGPGQQDPLVVLSPPADVEAAGLG